MESKRRGYSVAGLSVGLVAVAAALALNGGTAALGRDADPSPPTIERGLREVLHTPPLLVEKGAPVTLRYDVVCQADPFGRPCAVAGRVFVRSREEAFSEVPLAADGDSALVGTIAGKLLQQESFEYYAVVESGSGESVNVPAGGAAAPHRVWIVRRLTSVVLGKHRFGETREPDRSVIQAGWGTGPDSLGVSRGRDRATIGPSAFDVAPSGSLVVLDQVNDRLAVYPAGAISPRFVSIPFGGGEGDLAAGDDGAIYVLDHGGPGDAPLVRSFTPAGVPVGVVQLAGRSPDMLRTGPGGAFVHAYPGDMWFPVGKAGFELQPRAQTAAARAGKSVGGSVEVVVHGGPSEALLALVRGDDVLHAWRVSSGTSLGEIQLAEPFGSGLLVVLRLWAESEAEFVALVLTPAGLSKSFAVEAIEWAESAPLGRFRLHDNFLYQLRSAPSGAAVVEFSLGGIR